MHGYWQNKAETEKALKDGWLHTGDVGHLDEKGRIVITDRKKDMIVNDKGDNVAPQKVEGMLTLQPEIAQAMVSGDKRPYLVGLVVRLQRRGYLASKHRFMADVEAALAAVQRVRDQLFTAAEGNIGRGGSDDTTR